HLEAAIAVGKYLEDSVVQVFASFGTSSSKVLETKLLDFLKVQGGPLQEREVYRKLNISAGELERLVTPLLKIGLVKISYAKAGRGRQVRQYEAI
ncbi:MAG: hypothetical protein WCF70_03400, partial [Dehalococcoidales bacterium]